MSDDLDIPHWNDRGVRERHECEMKHAFNSPGEAANSIKRMKRNRRSMDGHVHPYRCNFCGKWHVGQVLQCKKIRMLKPKKNRKGGRPG